MGGTCRGECDQAEVGSGAMSNKRPVLPTTRLGKVAAVTLLVAIILQVAGTAASFLVRIEPENNAPNPLGLLIPAFLLATLVGAILSWIAIARKDRSRLLLIVAIIASVGFLLVFLFEAIEAISMSV